MAEEPQAVARAGQTGQATSQEGHSSANRSEEAMLIQAWYSSPPRNLPIPEVHQAADQEAPVSEVGERNCPGSPVGTEFCQWSNPGAAGGSRGLPCWPI